jgi:hypothetical protein
VSAVHIWIDRSWRSQECAADGGAVAPGDYDQLHHFIAGGVWDAVPLETELLRQADRLVGGSDAVLVIDDTTLPKSGNRSVELSAGEGSASARLPLKCGAEIL